MAENTPSAKASSGSASDLPPPSERGELVERLRQAFGEPIHIDARDFLEKVIADVFCRHPDMSGDQRKRLNSRELHAVQDVAGCVMSALLSAEAQITRLEGERDEARASWVALRELMRIAELNWKTETARLSALLDQAREVIPGLLTLARAYTKGINVDGDNVADIRNGSAFLTRLSKTGGEGEEGVSPSRTSPSSPDSRRPEALSDLEGEFARQVARLEHSGDDGFSWPEADPDDARDALDSLIARARDLLVERR